MATQGEAGSGTSPRPPQRLRCATHLYSTQAPLKPEVIFKLSANYRGREMELDMTEPSLNVYTLVAIKSKVATINFKTYKWEYHKTSK